MNCKCIKVCGMRDADNIREVERLRVGDGTSGMELGIDLMDGFQSGYKAKPFLFPGLLKHQPVM